MNISRHLTDMARRFPSKKAIVLPNGRFLTYFQVEKQVNGYAQQFMDLGIEKGMRVLTLVRPGFDFVPVIYALFRMGAIPVLIDPGMKVKNFLACVKECAPHAMVAIPLGHLVRLFFRFAFKGIRIRVVVGARWWAFLGNVLQKGFSDDAVKPKTLSMPTEFDQTAAILFTSGSTGVPKGVPYTHGQFDGQRQALQTTYGIETDEVDLVAFPLFLLFSVSWGVTAVVAPLNPRSPAKANGKRIASVIQRFGVTHTAGSPAIWKQLFEHCETQSEKLSTIKRILMAGAPVPERLLHLAVRWLPKNAEVFTPYGATEALPLTNIGYSELASCFEKTRQGKGTCVGRPLSLVEMAIMKPIEGSVQRWDESLRLGLNEIGEIVVKGPLVTRAYFNRAESTQMAKISDENGFWHRMGDMGYFDSKGRLWFCGRKDHRVQTSERTLYPVQLEGLFNAHPRISRTALVGIGKQGHQAAVLVVEGKLDPQRIEALKHLVMQNQLASFIQGFASLEKFPVDVRHNIKIDRPKISALLAKDKKLCTVWSPAGEGSSAAIS